MAKGKIVKKGTVAKRKAVVKKGAVAKKGTVVKKGTAKAVTPKKGEVQSKPKPSGEPVYGTVQQSNVHLEIVPAEGWTLEKVRDSLNNGEATWQPGSDRIVSEVTHEPIAIVVREEHNEFEATWAIDLE